MPGDQPCCRETQFGRPLPATSSPRIPSVSWLHESRAHLKLALPLSLGYVGLELMTLVDSIMVGRFDTVALAGLGVANVVLLTFGRFGAGVMMGLDSLAPKAIGNGSPERARRLFRSTIKLAFLLGIPLTLLGAACPYLFSLAGVDSDVAYETTIYLYGRLPSLLPYLFFIASSSYLQALGKTRPIVWAVFLGSIVNFGADALFVFGDSALHSIGLPGAGIPAMGGLGASISTCLVTLVMAVSLALTIRRHRVEEAEPGNSSDMRRIWDLGLPVGLQHLAEVGVFAIVGVTAGRLGAVAGAAHQIALTCASITFSIALGMGAATSVRVGHAIGRGDTPAARRAGLLGVAWGAISMCAFWPAFVLLPEMLSSWFTNDSAVIAAAPPLLLVAALFQLSDAIQIVLAGALRGAGDTRAGFLGSLAGHYGVGVWVALGLGLGTSLGVTGLWLGLCAGLTACAIGLSARFLWLTSRPITGA